MSAREHFKYELLFELRKYSLIIRGFYYGLGGGLGVGLTHVLFKSLGWL